MSDLDVLKEKFTHSNTVRDKKPYTIYEIEVRSSSTITWVIYKRYTAFYALHQALIKAITSLTEQQRNYIQIQLPPLPPKRLTRSLAVEFVEKRKKVWDEAKAAMKNAAEDMERYYNRGRKEAEEFVAGDKVWLDSRNIKTTRPVKKLDDKWFGPYEVIAKVGRAAYKLKLPATMKIHPVFHVQLLRKYEPDEIAERNTIRPPEPDVVDGEKEWEVEEILNSRKRGRGLQYLVKWKGFVGAEAKTWQPRSDLTNCQEEIDLFHEKYPQAPRL